MTFRRLTPMLRTPDLPGTLALYRDVLGFDVASGAPAHGWLALRRDGAELMRSTPNDHEGDTTPETFAYGMREFAIYDNNGYLLQFGTPVR